MENELGKERGRTGFVITDKTSRLPIGAGTLVSLVFHVALILFVLHLVRPQMTLVTPHKKPVVIQLEPPPPPPPPPKPPEPIKPLPPPPPKVPPPPRLKPPPPPEQIQTQAQAVPLDVPSAPPPPPPLPAPPAPPTVGTSVPSAYYNTLQSVVQNAIQYPPASVRAGEEGVVKMRVHFDRSGTVLDVELVSSSGFAKLDYEAKDVFHRIGKFPPVPATANIGTDEFIVELPINFTLE